MPEKFLCIHGHFYQPPREDPWMDMVFPEGSAAPARNWNERICRESYGPLAFARRLDGSGRIMELLNCYEWMSFNVGPTLLTWMERQAPEVYARILDADRKSAERLGHGNALAQVYHHVILPLASDLDRQAEVAWAVADFEARFKRRPEGLWLSEAAVDDRTLEILADEGIAFTILAPRQVAAVDDGDGNWRDTDEGGLDITQPYLVELSGGRSMAVFFYDGPVSQSVAFEGLLRDGERFWQRLSGAGDSGLLSLATDGETYGHHFAFGEMALAYVLSQARAGRDGWRTTNYGAYLAAHPAKRRARLRQASSWSCVHGVERWRADCGCSTGGHPDWNQRWRGPLREGLNAIKTEMDAHFLDVGRKVFRDPAQGLKDFGKVLAGLWTPAAFGERHFLPGLDEQARDTGFKLLTMEKWALSSFASCAWFFDDLGRIEPLNALTFALRAMGLAQRTGCRDLEPLLLSHLGQASSNDPGLGSGLDLWNREVRSRRETVESLVSQALFTLWAEARMPASGKSATAVWPGVEVSIEVAGLNAEDQPSGKAAIAWRHEPGLDRCTWTWEQSESGDPMASCVRVESPERGSLKCVPGQYLPWEKRQDLAVKWVSGAAGRIWSRELEQAAVGVYLFHSFREAQRTQTVAEHWERFWAALCWTWIMGQVPGRGDLLGFLRQTGQNHPDAHELCRRIGETVCGLLVEKLPDWRRIAFILSRALDLGLTTDLWGAQNTYWLRRERGVTDAEVARLLWFTE